MSDVYNNPTTQEVASNTNVITLTSLDWPECDFERLTETQELVQDTLTRKGISLFYGKTHCGKTWVVHYLAMCVALGIPFADKQLVKGGVLYIASEDGDGVAQRTAAAKYCRGLENDDIPFTVITCPVLINEDRYSSALGQFVADLPYTPALIVVDTMHQSYSGNQREEEGMNKFVRDLRGISEAVGCHIIIVHHTTKANPDAPSGSYTLECGVDHQYKVTLMENEMSIFGVHQEKRRGLSQSWKSSIAFRTHDQELPGFRDQWGRPKSISYCLPADYDFSNNKEREPKDTPEGKSGELYKTFKRLCPGLNDATTTAQLMSEYKKEFPAGYRYGEAIKQLRNNHWVLQFKDGSITHGTPGGKS